ncbi:hypothetical protein RJT34_17519 [Clitoria ternatea]|uniref:DUF674 family protein n=1 Tax=Clitoria ternatea TaxID=43366 RepID=A0AAN9J944_CLITE
MATIETQQRVTLKLMVSKERKKVIFAEAGKDFVDVLFGFMTLPLGTIVRLVNSKDSNIEAVKVGSLNSLYESVQNLDEECLFTDTCKEMLLKPRNSMEAYCKHLKLNIEHAEPSQYFVCNNLLACRYKSSLLLSTSNDKTCTCGNLLAKPISLNSNGPHGFVKSNVSFIITDDLHVVPTSMDTFFHLMKNSGIKDMSCVNEMIVNITQDQVTNLLKSCLVSETTLTDFFLEEELFYKRLERVNPSSCDFNAKDDRKIEVKLMKRKLNGKIVFAQGKEDFADFLLSFLTLQLGGVVHLLEGCSSMGNIDGLYKSIVDLDDVYWTTKEVKNKLVNLGIAPHFKLNNHFLPIHESDAPNLFCYTNVQYASHKPGRISSTFLTDCYLTFECKAVQGHLETCKPLEFIDGVSNSGNGEGFVKGPTMYMVTDGLVVMPMSSISIASLLKSMGIPFSGLEEKVVSIGIEEGVSILRASLTSPSALTNGLGHLLNNNVKRKRK